MAGLIQVLGMKDKLPDWCELEISPVSKDEEWGVLSPFNLGPCMTADGIMFLNVENLWQYSKVYPEHIMNRTDAHSGDIAPEWFSWHISGSLSKRAHRYPMGKGAVPRFSKWGAMRLSYVTARKAIYVPTYAQLLVQHPKFKKLLKLHKSGTNIVIRDYDAYDIHKAYPDSSNAWVDAVNNPNRKFGHGFVIGMALILHTRPLWYTQWIL
ncbi:hypothetical protein fHeYen902_156 [Yersinia phage fHe-Yen9-02]|nr:hypothetical protein fHeYen902_156 [Yersinia phage fHe-Yen9-02]